LAFARAYEKLSPETKALRFGIGKPRLTEREAQTLVDVDHHDHEALVALCTVDQRPLGVARFVRLKARPEVAEVAITIGDRWQGHGLSHLLLEPLVRRASEEGITTLQAMIVPGNRRAIALVHHWGFEFIGHEGGLAVYELAISGLPAETR
jgi:L-amino acid N-acyltransferase YncA